METFVLHISQRLFWEINKYLFLNYEVRWDQNIIILGKNMLNIIRYLPKTSATYEKKLT